MSFRLSPKQPKVLMTSFLDIYSIQILVLLGMKKQSGLRTHLVIQGRIWLA